MIESSSVKVSDSVKKQSLSEGTVDPEEVSLHEVKEGSISTVDAMVLQRESAEADNESQPDKNQTSSLNSAENRPAEE